MSFYPVADDDGESPTSLIDGEKERTGRTTLPFEH
jgi:hypothetical protein